MKAIPFEPQRFFDNSRKRPTAKGPRWLGGILASALVATVSSNAAAFPGLNGKIAFEDSSGIAVIDPDGNNVSLLIPVIVPGQPLETPAWSADGSQIAFSDGGQDIWAANADGSNPHVVISKSDPQVELAHPSWSPDGTRIAYDSETEIFNAGAPPTIHSTIYVINANGTGLTALFQGTDAFLFPAFSPDGSRIALVDLDASGNSRIAVANADGTGLAILSTGPGHDNPSWSPDGSQIAFHGDVSTPPFQRNEIFTINADGTQQRQRTNGAGLTAVAWSPDGALIAAAQGVLEIFDTISGSISNIDDCDCAYNPSWQPLLNTPVGAGVQVLPEDPDSLSSPVTITFADVSRAGGTALRTNENGPPPPDGFGLSDSGIYYFVETTAGFSGAVVCITDPTITAASRLFHYAGPVDVTAPGYPDVANQIICSIPLDALSPFVIAEALSPQSGASGSSGSTGGASSVSSVSSSTATSSSTAASSSAVASSSGASSSSVVSSSSVSTGASTSSSGGDSASAVVSSSSVSTSASTSGSGGTGGSTGSSDSANGGSTGSTGGSTSTEGGAGTTTGSGGAGAGGSVVATGGGSTSSSIANGGASATSAVSSSNAGGAGGSGGQSGVADPIPAPGGGCSCRMSEKARPNGLFSFGVLLGGALLMRRRKRSMPPTRRPLVF